MLSLLFLDLRLARVAVAGQCCECVDVVGQPARSAGKAIELQQIPFERSQQVKFDQQLVEGREDLCEILIGLAEPGRLVGQCGFQCGFESFGGGWQQGAGDTVGRRRQRPPQGMSGQLASDSVDTAGEFTQVGTGFPERVVSRKGRLVLQRYQGFLPGPGEGGSGRQALGAGLLDAVTRVLLSIDHVGQIRRLGLGVDQQHAWCRPRLVGSRLLAVVGDANAVGQSASG